MKYVQQVRGKWIVRITVPDELREIVGVRELVEKDLPSDARTREKLAHGIINRFFARIDEARELYKARKGAPAITLSVAAKRHYANAVAIDQAKRAASRQQQRSMPKGSAPSIGLPKNSAPPVTPPPPSSMQRQTSSSRLERATSTTTPGREAWPRCGQASLLRNTLDRACCRTIRHRTWSACAARYTGAARSCGRADPCGDRGAGADARTRQRRLFWSAKRSPANCTRP